jgi:hypothetical protein
MKFNFVVKMLAFSLVFFGLTACGSLKAVKGSPPPTDYSAIGENQSVVVVYFDDLVYTAGFLSTKQKATFQKQVRVGQLVIVGTDDEFKSPMLMNVGVDPKLLKQAKMSGAGAFFDHSCQIPVVNGSYQLKLQIVMAGPDGKDIAVDAVAINVDLDNMAATYKIRNADANEKNTAQAGIGNEAFILELVSLKPIR